MTKYFIKNSQKLKILVDGSSIYRKEHPFIDNLPLIAKNTMLHSFWIGKLEVKQNVKVPSNYLQKYTKKFKD